MTHSREKVHSVTPDEFAREVWEDESPATGEPRPVPHDKWHPDVNELLERSTSFEE
jgi:hypothetical protein